MDHDLCFTMDDEICLLTNGRYRLPKDRHSGDIPFNVHKLVSDNPIYTEPKRLGCIKHLDMTWTKTKVLFVKSNS